MKYLAKLKYVMTIVFLLSCMICFFACEKQDGQINGAVVLPSINEGETVTFTVTYDSCGGSDVSSVTVESGETLKQPSNPIRKGYEFTGWYLTGNLLLKWDFAKDTVTSNITLYAGWKLLGNVFIDSPAFSINGKDYTYAVASPVENLDLTNELIFAQSDYRYAFYLDQNCKELACEEDTAYFDLSYGQNTYYLKIMDSGLKEVSVIRFIINRNALYNVSFYDLGGALIESVVVEEGNPVSESPKDYVVVGYDIIWLNGTQKWVFGPNGTKVYSNVDLHSSTISKIYTITFDTDGGELNQKSEFVSYGSNFILPMPQRAGFGFIGWFTEDEVRLTDTNGKSLTEWSIHSDAEVRVIAKWSNNNVKLVHTATIKRKNATDATEILAQNDLFPYGETNSYEINEEYFAITKTSNNTYGINVFEGWFIAGVLQSRDRYFTTEKITKSTTVEEVWNEITITPEDPSGIIVDQTLTFIGGETYKEHGYFAFNEVITVTAACECNKHKFVGWAGDLTGSNAVIIINPNKSMDILAKWSSIELTVRTRLVGTIEEFDVSALTDLLDMDLKSVVTQNEIATLTVLASQTYTFLGWYDSDLQVISNDFACELMIENTSLTVYPTWMTTEDFAIRFGCGSSLSDENPVAFDVYVEANENRLGGVLKLTTRVLPGMVFVDLEDALGNVYTGNEIVMSISLNNRIETINSTQNKTVANVNLTGAGAISYKINTKPTVQGSTYGESFKFKGMVIGDNLQIKAETYDGYTFLGWYRDGSFYQTDSNLYLTVSNVEAEYKACWKAISYTVKLGTNLPAAGSQSYYATQDGKQPGENITIIAGINTGYRFDGWYNEKDEFISYNFGYSFNVKDLGKEYIAKYTLIRSTGDGVISLNNKKVEIAIDNDGTDQKLEQILAYVYKYADAETGAEKEKLVVKVATNKKEVVTSEGEKGMYGYRYEGLYDTTDTASDDGEFIIPSGGLDPTDLSYSYEFDYNGQEKKLVAKWTAGKIAGGYYRSAAKIDSEYNGTKPGEIYYISYTAKLILVAEPYNGYLFAGWTNQNGVILSNESVYDTGGGANQTFIAHWKKITAEQDPQYGIVLSDNLYYPEGCSVKLGGSSYTSTSNDEIVIEDDISIKATTDNGYLFVGWFLNGLFLSADEEINFKGFTKQNEQILSYYDGSNEIVLTDPLLMPKWRETGATVTADSLEDISVKGFIGEDGQQKIIFRVESEKYYSKYGAAWYDGYVFGGWYNSNGDLVGTDYELIVNAISAETYYKAVWIKSDVTVNIKVQYVDEHSSILDVENDSEYGKISYAFYYDGINMHLLLWAEPTVGYKFNGWPNDALEYDVVLTEGSTEFSYEQSFTKISNTYNLKAISYGKNGLEIELANYKPDIIQTKNTVIMTASDIEKYEFLYWTVDGIETTKERTLVFTANTETESQSYRAVYRDFSTDDVLKKVKAVTEYEFSSNIQCCGYSVKEDGESEYSRFIAINVDVPDGYLFYVKCEFIYLAETTVSDRDLYGETAVLCPVKWIEDYLAEHEADTVRFVVYFEEISDLLARHIATEKEIDNLSFTKYGRYTLGQTASANTYYYEFWEMNSKFAMEDYSFIGWYNKDGELLTVKDKYVTSAFEKDQELSIRFGKYNVELINTDEEAGTIEIEGYTLHIEFDLNTDVDLIKSTIDSIPAQELNVGDRISYPVKVIDRAIPGYMFGGWYTDSQCTGEIYDFSAEVKSSTVLYAKWIKVSDIGVDSNNVLYTNGKVKNIVVNGAGLSTEELDDSRYIYTLTAAVSGEYRLMFDHVSQEQVTELSVVGSSHEYIYRNTVYGLGRVTVVLNLIGGETYSVSIIGKEYVGKAASISIYRPSSIECGKRSSLIPYGSEFVAKATAVPFSSSTNTAYYFVGWQAMYVDGVEKNVIISGQKQSENFTKYEDTLTLSYEDYQKYSMDGVITLVALWQRYELDLVTSDYDGGTVDVEFAILGSSYGPFEGQRVWRLNAIPSANYTFQGWQIYNEENEFSGEGLSISNSEDVYYINNGKEKIMLKVVWEYSGSKKCTISYNVSSGINSPYNISLINPDNKSIIPLYDPYRPYKITTSIGNSGATEETEIGYYRFEGWYTDSNYRTRITYIDPVQFDFTQTSITLYAKWGTPIKGVEILTDVDGSKYFYLGIYPQTKVSISGLTEDTNLYDSKYDYRSVYKYYDDAGNRYVKIDESTAYRCDPIRWNILYKDGGVAYAQSAVVLDMRKFNLSTNNSDTYYANNWTNSALCYWLTNDFYKISFIETEKNLIEIGSDIVNNNASSGNPGYRDPENYPWAIQDSVVNTVFVPSYEEKMNQNYIFNKTIAYSDYALDKMTANSVNGYWLRSWGDSSRKALAVSDNGNIIQLSVDTLTGVCPVIRIDLSHCDE